MSYTRRTRRNEYYLDVSDYVLSHPRQVIPSPRRTPIQMHTTDVNLYFIDVVTLLIVAMSIYFHLKLDLFRL